MSVQSQSPNSSDNKNLDTRLPPESRTQRYFVKDGDDNYRRPQRRTNSNTGPKIPVKRCECGGKMKLRGSIGCAGQTSSKCTKCSKRIYANHYRGTVGLIECYSPTLTVSNGR